MCPTPGPSAPPTLYVLHLPVQSTAVIGPCISGCDCCNALCRMLLYTPTLTVRQPPALLAMLTHAGWQLSSHGACCGGWHVTPPPACWPGRTSAHAMMARCSTALLRSDGQCAGTASMIKHDSEGTHMCRHPGKYIGTMV